MTPSNIIDGLSRIRVPHIKTIVISGGEPTLQLDRHLCEALRSEGYTLHLETNGSHNIDDYADLIDHISMSPKQSLEETKLGWSTDIKLLYPWIHPQINASDFRSFSAKNRFIQPVDCAEYGSNLIDSIAALTTDSDLNDYRLSLQLHKVLDVK
jgi:organic radical activating enzyme